MAIYSDAQRARRLATDLVRDIMESNKAELERHNQIGDTAFVFKKLFDDTREMYLNNVGKNSGAVKHYFDQELNSRILSRRNRPSYKS